MKTNTWFIYLTIFIKMFDMIFLLNLFKISLFDEQEIPFTKRFKTFSMSIQSFTIDG